MGTYTVRVAVLSLGHVDLGLTGQGHRGHLGDDGAVGVVERYTRVLVSVVAGDLVFLPIDVRTRRASESELALSALTLQVDETAEYLR